MQQTITTTIVSRGSAATMPSNAAIRLTIFSCAATDIALGAADSDSFASIASQAMGYKVMFCLRLPSILAVLACVLLNASAVRAQYPPPVAIPLQQQVSFPFCIGESAAGCRVSQGWRHYACERGNPNHANELANRECQLQGWRGGNPHPYPDLTSSGGQCGYAFFSAMCFR
jgi:hypothetical protein